MRVTLESLYPADAGKLAAVEKVEVPGFAQAATEGVLRQHSTPVREHYGERLLEMMSVDEDDGRRNLGLVNKIYPHSLYDLMVLAADEVPRSSFCDLGAATGATVLGIAHAFVHWLHEPDTVARYGLDGAHYHFSFNFDRDTVDRDNSMYYEKQFHLHMNCWPVHYFREAGERPLVAVEDIALRRRLFDPLIHLAGRVVYDKCAGSVAGVPMMAPDTGRDLRLGLPFGIKLQWQDWSCLADGRTAACLAELHRQMCAVYSDLKRAFTGSDAVGAPWRRPQLLDEALIIGNLAALDYLSAESREGLSTLAKVLRNVSDRTIARLRISPRWQTRHLSLNGLDYSVCIYSQAPIVSGIPPVAPVYMSVQCKLFADMGGAGLLPMGKRQIVKISRGARLFDPDEIAIRRDFQSGFIERLRSGIRSFPGLQFEDGQRE